jgi:ribosome recycling factor
MFCIPRFGSIIGRKGNLSPSGIEQGRTMAQAEKPNLARYRERMEKAVAALKEEYASLRTGRASAGLLDQVQVEAYGARSPISHVGSVSVPDPRSLTVAVWDKGLVVSVEKAIRNAGLGLNPVVEGQNLRIPIPTLTEERRREIVRLAGKYAEQQRIAVRNVRREAMEDLRKSEKDGVISQDDHRRLDHEVQKITDEAIDHVDEALKTKEHEIMQV